MINKNNIRKRLLMLLIALLTIFNNTNYVEAYGGGGGGSYSEPIGKCPPSGPGPLSCPTDGLTATCHKAEEWYEESNVYPKTWDLNGNYIGEDIDLESMFNQTELKGVLAGTYIGLDLYEEKYYWLRVNIGSTGIQEYHLCTYEEKYDCSVYDEKTDKLLEKKTCYNYYEETNPGTEATACPDKGGDWKLIGTEPTTYKCTQTCEEALIACKAKHKPARWELNPSFTAEFQDSNDIISGNLPPVEATTTLHEIDDHDGNWYWYISDRKRFSYKLGKACINVKNGEIRYVTDSGECKPNDNEYEVKELPEYWKYFIPLNANSIDGRKIFLKSKEGGELSGTICESIISNYSDEYMNLITPTSGTFTGNLAEDKNKVSSGCKWGMNIKIPVVQRFYNEIVKNNTFEGFKGFNFYYKPIDINEPFPNGLTDTSIWYEWNKDKNNPNISSSYEQLTYSANTSQNEQEIREYNNQSTVSNDEKDYPYASWEGIKKDDTKGGMNYKDGTSNFINTQGIITRHVEPKKDFYKLGCGPKNTNVNNVFTQTECDR